MSMSKDRAPFAILSLKIPTINQKHEKLHTKTGGQNILVLLQRT